MFVGIVPQLSSRSVLLLVPALLLLLVLQRRAQLLDEHRQHLVQRVHHASLQPLGDGRPGVVEAQLLQDVVHADRVDFTARPGDEPGKRGEQTFLCGRWSKESGVYFPSPPWGRFSIGEPPGCYESKFPGSANWSFVLTN